MSGGCRTGIGARPPGATITFEISVKAGAPNAEDVRGAQAVPLAHIQHALDVDFSDVLEGERLPVVDGARPWRLLVLHMFGKVDEVDKIAGGGNASA